MARILIVDDEPTIRLTVRRILEPQGHVVVEAADGSQALDHCRSGLPDLLILDVYMPNMDGYELLRALRAGSMKPRIIMISGGSMVEKGEALAVAKGMGVNAVLEKPYEVAELLKMVEEVLA